MDDRPDSLNANAPTNGRKVVGGELPVEALQMLAREIVEQAGLNKGDPEPARRREIMRDAADTLKQLSTLSGSATVAVVVIQNTFGVTGSLADITQRMLGTEGVLSPLHSLAAVTLGLISTAFMLSVVGLVWTCLSLTRHDEQAVSRYPVKLIRWLTAFAAFFLFSGITVFVVNAITAT